MVFVKEDVGNAHRDGVDIVLSDAERQAIADEWNINIVATLKDSLVRRFKNQGLARIKAIEPQFGTFDAVQMLAAMQSAGMLTAFSGWSADGKLVANIYVYVRDEAIKRVRGIGGHPDLTLAQLALIDPTAAFPFASVDGTDTGWPT